MINGYTKIIIPQTIAPPNALNIAVNEPDGGAVGQIDISSMRHDDMDGLLYSFGAISDLHLGGYDRAATCLDEALTYFEEEGCAFTAQCGDITNRGFWADASTYDPSQMAAYKQVIDAHPNLTVYGVAGNHESYNKPILENLADLKEYTASGRFGGIELFYTVDFGPDVFIFMSQPAGSAEVLPEEWIKQLRLLQTTLEENRNKRCFVFQHLTFSCDSGNPENIHNAFWGDLEPTMIDILASYPNVIVFHGHSHLDPAEQRNYRNANYNYRWESELYPTRGYRSIHVPSPMGCRVTADGVLQKESHESLRSGWIVRVYADYIVLRGVYFATGSPIHVAQYRIDTTLQTVEPGAYIDKTGQLGG